MAKSPSAQPPKWIKPQLTRVVDEAPAGDDWLNEIKYDEYRVHARLEPGKIQLQTRTGIHWFKRQPRGLGGRSGMNVGQKQAAQP
jgi:bifunctional non-homologous end joining protein LigD